MASSAQRSAISFARLCSHLNEVDLGKGLVVSRPLNVKNGDDILVVEISQQLHLAQSAQAEHGVVKGGDLLDGHFLSRRLVECRAGQVSLVDLALLVKLRTRRHRTRPRPQHPGYRTARTH